MVVCCFLGVQDMYVMWECWHLDAFVSGSLLPTLVFTFNLLASVFFDQLRYRCSTVSCPLCPFDIIFDLATSSELVPFDSVAFFLAHPSVERTLARRNGREASSRTNNLVQPLVLLQNHAILTGEFTLLESVQLVVVPVVVEFFH